MRKSPDRKRQRTDALELEAKTPGDELECLRWERERSWWQKLFGG